MGQIFAIVVLLALLMTGASAQSKPKGTQEQRNKLIRDYETIGRADTMAVIYTASCLNVDNQKRDECYAKDMATLSAAIKAVENKKEHPRVAEDAMLIVKLKSNRHDTGGIPGPDHREGPNVSLTVYDARNNSVVYERSRAVLLLSNDARQVLTEFLDIWAFLH